MNNESINYKVQGSHTTPPAEALTLNFKVTKQAKKKPAAAIGYNALLKNLLIGKYSCIAKRKSNYRKSEWCIYQDKMNPLRYIGKRSFLAASEMLKVDKNGLHTLDLRKVRSLHGNCWLKKLYKERLKKRKDEKLKA